VIAALEVFALVILAAAIGWLSWWVGGYWRRR
jgi:hypothetical protein